MNRQEVIQWLEAWLDDDCDALEVPEEFTPEIVEDILGLLRGQEKATGGWISVKDRLPEDSNEYLTFSSSGLVNVLPYSSRYKSFNAFDFDGGKKYQISDITHWQPLPEPPEAAGVGSEKMEKINCYTHYDYQPEEVYTFSVVLCDNEVDRDYERFSTAALETLLEMLLGKKFILDDKYRRESQTARIYDTTLERVPGRKTKAGEEYVRLTAKVYIPQENINREAIDLIERGIWKETSIACAVKRSVCSVCRQGTCSHIKGEIYDGKLCHRVLMEPAEAYECTFVRNIGGEKNA